LHAGTPLSANSANMEQGSVRAVELWRKLILNSMFIRVYYNLRCFDDTLAAAVKECKDNFQARDSKT
jgi:hypothetical protein